jgi:hypothetical protein
LILKAVVCCRKIRRTISGKVDAVISCKVKLYLTLDDLVVLEQVFSLNVYVYDLQETEPGDIAARLVRRSPYKYDDTMNLNLYEQHFSYIKDLRSYSHSYLCSKCDRLWKHVGKLHRHERTCTGDVIYKYPGGAYHTTQTVFDRLED